MYIDIHVFFYAYPNPVGEETIFLKWGQHFDQPKERPQSRRIEPAFHWRFFRCNECTGVHSLQQLCSVTLSAHFLGGCISSDLSLLLTRKHFVHSLAHLMRTGQERIASYSGTQDSTQILRRGLRSEVHGMYFTPLAIRPRPPAKDALPPPPDQAQIC